MDHYMLCLYRFTSWIIDFSEFFWRTSCLWKTHWQNLFQCKLVNIIIICVVQKQF